MYLKYYLVALVKLGALLLLPPYVAGVVSGFARPKKALALAPFIAVGYVLLIELIVLVEKGAPLLFANLYFMFSLSPKAWLQYLIGFGGLALWILFAVIFFRKGARLAFRLGRRADGSQ